MRQAGLRVPCGPPRNPKCGIPKAISSRPPALGKALYRWFMNNLGRFRNVLRRLMSLQNFSFKSERFAMVLVASQRAEYL